MYDTFLLHLEIELRAQFYKLLHHLAVFIFINLKIKESYI